MPLEETCSDSMALGSRHDRDVLFIDIYHVNGLHVLVSDTGLDNSL
jgi:hypothetical protein